MSHSQLEQHHNIGLAESWLCKTCSEPEVTFFKELPPYIKAKDLDKDTCLIQWGTFQNGVEIKNALNSAYDEVVTWRKNLFKLPSGKHGKAFIHEITKWVNEYVSSSSGLESVAMTAIMILPPLLLQKPTKRSKTKDHNKFLETRLQWWSAGNISDLIKEGRAIQNRFKTSSTNNQQNNEKIFSRLMLQGKVAAALRWITNCQGSVLKISRQVIRSLSSKHPDPAIADE